MRSLYGRDGMGSRADADPRYLMRSRASRRKIRRRRRRASGEPDGEGRSPPDLGRNGNVATMADDETLAQREAQAGPFPLAFRRHKRLEEPLPNLGRDPGPRVGDREQERIVRRLALDAHLPVGGRLEGIFQEVHEHLIHPNRVDAEYERAVPEIAALRHARLTEYYGLIGGRLHDVAQIRLDEVRRPWPREFQELGGDARRGPPPRADLLYPPLDFRVRAPAARAPP